MHIDQPFGQGPSSPGSVGQHLSPSLASIPKQAPSSPQASKESRSEAFSPAQSTDLATTAPIHKVSRGPRKPTCSKGPRTNIDPDSRYGVTGENLTIESSAHAANRFSTKITGVATIILPPHQNSGTAFSTSPSVESASHSSGQPALSLLKSASKSVHPYSASSRQALVSRAYDHPACSTLLSSPALNETSAATASTSPSPGKQRTCVRSSIVTESVSVLPNNTCVVDLTQCNATPLDHNNNNIHFPACSINTTSSTATNTNITSSTSNENSITRNRNSAVSNNNIYTFNYGIDTPSINSSSNDNSIKNKRSIVTDRSKATFPHHGGYPGDDVFMNVNDQTKDNVISRGNPDVNLTLSPSRSEPGFSNAGPYYRAQPTVLPSFSSTFNDTSLNSYNSSGDFYNKKDNFLYQDYFRGASDERSLVMMNSSQIDSSSLAYGLSRSDSGFGGSPCSSRNNSSSSLSSTGGSMDLDYEDTGYCNNQEMPEERNYTSLTSVRSLCHGHDVLSSIINDDEEKSLQIYLSDSSPLSEIKPEPLEEYESLSMSEFLNNLQPSDLDSDGYESSSTDNGHPQYTQLEEASAYSFFNTGSILGTFPPMPVSTNDQTKSCATSMGSRCYVQTSPESDQGFVDRWIVAKENLPDFGKLQDPSVEEEEKPAPSRRRSVCSPKEKKKAAAAAAAARESPALSDKSSPDRKKPGRKKGQVSNVLHLWEFMRDLLKDPSRRGDIIEWISEKEGVFRVVNSAEVARLWGEKKKNKKEMTYEKMSRSLRYSRLEGYFSDLPKDKNYPKKLCFKFGPKSKDWY